MRASHYLKGNASSETLHELIVVDTETDAELDASGAERHYLRFGWAAYVRRIRNGQWSAPDWYRFDDAADLWSWVQLRTRPKTKLYIVAHNWSFDALVTRVFDELPRRGWAMCNACLDAPPLIVKWRRRAKTIIMLDSLNWWRDALRNLERAAGLSKLRMPGKRASRARWDAYCRRDVRVVLRLITRWADFLRLNDLGGFAPTLASQSMRTYRHRYLTHKILIDDSESALSLARDAYMGGRVECFRIGKIKGPIHVLDVNSMYPAVMREREYPTKLISVQSICQSRELRALARRYCIVAECDASTDVPCVPVRHDGRLVFPVGNLHGVWTTPELLLLLQIGSIKRVYRVAIYERAPIFSAFVDDMWAQRCTARDAGDKIREHQWKILMNSLYGKFGQRGRYWEDWDTIRDKTVRVWDEYDADDKVWRYYRQISGRVQRRVDDGESRDSHPAIAAHVTAAARVRLWRLMQRAGRSHVIYCDTDSVWTDAVGFARLRPLIDPTALGSLKHERTARRVVLYGPKDYVVEGNAKIKGVRKNALEVERGVFIQAHWRGMAGALRDGDLTAPKITGQLRVLARNYRKGTVLANGRVSPFRLFHW